MVSRRQERHRKLGIQDNASTAGFLVNGEFREIASRTGFGVGIHYPFEGVPRKLRRAYCKLRRASPPARFPLFVLERN
jgi:hypothetical protein